MTKRISHVVGIGGLIRTLLLWDSGVFIFTVSSSEMSITQPFLFNAYKCRKNQFRLKLGCKPGRQSQGALVKGERKCKRGEQKGKENGKCVQECSSDTANCFYPCATKFRRGTVFLCRSTAMGCRSLEDICNETSFN